MAADSTSMVQQLETIAFQNALGNTSDLEVGGAGSEVICLGFRSIKAQAGSVVRCHLMLCKLARQFYIQLSAWLAASVDFFFFSTSDICWYFCHRLTMRCRILAALQIVRMSTAHCIKQTIVVVRAGYYLLECLNIKLLQRGKANIPHLHKVLRFEPVLHDSSCVDLVCGVLSLLVRYLNFAVWWAVRRGLAVACWTQSRRSRVRYCSGASFIKISLH